MYLIAKIKVLHQVNKKRLMRKSQKEKASLFKGYVKQNQKTILKYPNQFYSWEMEIFFKTSVFFSLNKIKMKS